MLLASVVAANLLSRFAALGLAYYFSFRVLARWGNLVSGVAAGLLLTVACTHLIPEAVAESVDPVTAGYVLLLSFLVFVVLDCVLECWAGHSHGIPTVKQDCALLGGKTRVVARDCCGTGAGSSRAPVLLLGMACHNFVDGILVAAAFMVDFTSGWIVTGAIFAHEIPQVMGQLVILNQMGMERMTATRWAGVSASAALIGGIFGWMLFAHVHGVMGYAMLVSAASFIFVVLANLLPELVNATHGDKEKKKRFPVQEIAGLVLGVVISLMILSPMHEEVHVVVHDDVHESHAVSGVERR